MGVLWPWLAEVHVAGERVCTGILVAPGWVLAATHCILRWVSPISLARGKNWEMGQRTLSIEVCSPFRAFIAQGNCCEVF